MLFKLFNGRKLSKLSGIPGPAPSFPLGNLSRFSGGRRPWEICAELRQEFGDLCCVWFLNQPALVVNRPELIELILDTQREDFYKDAPCQALAPVITRDSLFISNPPKWKAAREAHPLSVTPFQDWFPAQFGKIQSSIRESLQQWTSSASPLNLYDQTQRLSFRAFATAFWGSGLADKSFDWFQALARTGDRRMNMPVQLSPPLSPKFYSARREWYGQFESLVGKAKAEPEGGDDLLTVYLRNGSSMSDATLAEAMATNFFGGVFSCSSTVNTALYLLANHPQEREKLVAALRDCLSDGEFDAQQLSECRPLEFVMREAMRYYPAVPIYFRNSADDRDVQLAEYQLPPKTMCLLSNWHLHKFDEFWGDPLEFRPDRWDGGFAEANEVGSAYFFPFGRGPRMCVGAEFSLAFIRLTLALILLDTEVELDPDQPYEQGFFFGVMMPKLRARFLTR